MCHDYEGWFTRRLARPARDEEPAQPTERRTPEVPARAAEPAKSNPVPQPREHEPA